MLYARRSGANAADDRIVEELELDPRPEDVVVVTSDRDLRGRVTRLGAAVEGASAPAPPSGLVTRRMPCSTVIR